ncbi:MAG: hypothetical protein ACRENE_13640 [Polyangiaceae bacterium]
MSLRPYVPCVSLLLVMAATAACHHGGTSVSSEAGAAAASASAASPAGAAGECLASLDFVVPYQSYKNGDVIRAITVDGNQVLFRNADDLMRVPLAGGAPVTLSPAPSMTLQFDARPSMWLVGDKIVTQSPGAPAFLEAPKTGGSWTPIVNLSGGDLGSKLETGNHIVHTIFSGRPENAHPAIFDGTAFFWVEEHGASKGKPASSAIRSVPLTGSPARTLYEWEGGLRSLARAGDRLVFERQDPETKESTTTVRKDPKGKLQFDIKPPRPTMLMSMPAQGGTPELLAHFSAMEGSLGKGEVLVADGDAVYVSGYQDEDIQKAGTFRISAHPGSALQRLDDRKLSGEGFVYGDRIVIAGHGPIEPKPPRGDVFGNLGLVVMTGDRHGGALQRAACIHGNYTEHAYAIAGKTLLVSILNSDDRKAAIIRVPLP